MLIRKESQLNPGSCIQMPVSKFYEFDDDYQAVEKVSVPFRVIKAYPHHVLGCIINDNGEPMLKRSFTNAELLQKGIYKYADLLPGNYYGANIPVKNVDPIPEKLAKNKLLIQRRKIWLKHS